MLLRSKIWDRPEDKLRCKKAIRQGNLPMSEEFVLARIVDTQLELNPTEEERYMELERQEGKEVQDMVITWEDALEEREAKGKIEGKVEGELEATRRAIVLLSRHRHGQLPDSFAEKLEAIDNLSRLYEILEQVADGHSLEKLDLTP